METVEIKGQVRPASGKKPSKDLRRSGMVPCIIYGGTEQVSFFADTREFNKVLFTPNVYTININLGDKQFRTVLQETQFHPVTDALMHADFLQLDDNKAITIEIPVRITGNSVGVRAGGKLLIKKRKLKVKGLPGAMPDSINVDITNLAIGQSLKVQTLSLEGLVINHAPNVVIATVATTRAAQAAAAEAAKASGKK